jgi:hypothetical protein
MNVLIACEESQRVCIAFREKGYNAYSCDIQECSGNHPEWHIQENVLEIINGNCLFVTMDGKIHKDVSHNEWDLIIAHPPCTYLTVTGNRWFNIEKYGDKAKLRHEKREQAFQFFMEFIHAKCEHIAVENPVGYVSTAYRKPHQIIQPYMFGDPVRKSTCLWLKKLPKLKPTNIVDPIVKPGGFSGAAWAAKDENGKTIGWNDPRTAIIRSKTFKGIAKAMAEQWGKFIELDNSI